MVSSQVSTFNILSVTSTFIVVKVNIDSISIIRQKLRWSSLITNAANAGPAGTCSMSSELVHESYADVEVGIQAGKRCFQEH